MPVIFIFFLGLLVLYSLFISISTIRYAWVKAIVNGSASSFFGDFFEGAGGSWIVVLAMLVLSVPVYLILLVKLSGSNDSPDQSNAKVVENRHNTISNISRSTLRKSVAQMVSLTVGRSPDNDLVMIDPTV